MKRIEAIIKSAKLEDVKSRLFRVGIPGMTVSEVRWLGQPSDKHEVRLGSTFSVDFVPKVRIQIVVDDEIVHAIVEALLASVGAEGLGDDKIFISPITSVIRIRTGEYSREAIEDCEVRVPPC
jgi:nitrogen regulatory protein P-II 1